MSALVVITGAARGIGRACAERLAAPGVHMACVDIDAVGLAGTAKLVVDAGATASTHTVDVTDAAAVEAVADELQSTHGAASVLVNIVGGARVNGGCVGRTGAVQSDQHLPDVPRVPRRDVRVRTRCDHQHLLGMGIHARARAQRIRREQGRRRGLLTGTCC
jgi:NAD(P)-dependent dehydrogenase (short-subunit alcohol dehydrogenase family)